MKFTAFFILIASLHVSANGFSQQVTLSEKNAKLEKLFKAIKQQTGYVFFYDEELLQQARPVTIKVKDAPLETALNICFEDQPLSYSIVGTTVVIKQKATLDFQSKDNSSVISSPPPIDITGRVTDADGNPLVGASVKVKGTSIGTTTNYNGEFQLTGISENAMLEISYVGYELLTVAVNNRASIVASLKIKPESMNEVVINKGYYKTNRITEVGNVSTVSSKQIETQPINNPILALQSLVPGLRVIPNNGLPGSNIRVQIRGQNSISNGNEPMYIIDGVPYSPQLMPGLSSQLGDFTGGGSALNFINPADIESIDVLKDADATAIYGSRAANGVILITTKKGKPGKTKFNVNAQTGTSKMTGRLNLLNTRQYLDMRYEALKNDGIDLSQPPYNDPIYQLYNTPDLTIWDTTRQTDWQKELMGKSAQFTDIQTFISGGSSNTQFLIGSGFRKETVIYPGDFYDKKGFINFNINNTSNNQRFFVQLSGRYTTGENKLPNVDLSSTAIFLPPNAPALYNSDGSINWELDDFGNHTWENPLYYLGNKYKSKTNVLISNAVLSYQILNGLDVKSNFGYTNVRESQYQGIPLSAIPPAWRQFSQRNSNFVTNASQSWIIEPQINYSRRVKKAGISFLVGSTIQQNSNEGIRLYGEGFNSDLVMEDIKAAPTVRVDANSKSFYKYNALFGRLNLNWDERYLINLTARRDGTSRFGQKNRFHNFSAIGVAWVFSNENFFKKADFLSYGKIRSSFGTSGSDQVGDYGYLDLYDPTNGGGTAYQGTSGLSIRNLSNPYLAWEETEKTEVGLELGFFRNRILVTTSYFRNSSSNQLTSFLLPSITGATTIRRNLDASVKNEGWEFVIESKNLNTKNFDWNTSINLTTSRNKLQTVDSGMSANLKLLAGHSLNTVILYHFLGVDQVTGQYLVSDLHGQPTSTPNPATDRTIYLDLTPRYYGGIQNRLRYKALSLSFLVEFSRQMISDLRFGNYPGTFVNQPVSVLERWRASGDVANIQRFNSDYSIADSYEKAGLSDGAYSSQNFIRIQNISLGWQLPQMLKEKLHLANCQVYVHGQNVLTYQNKNRAYNYPLLRTITVGLQVAF